MVFVVIVIIIIIIIIISHISPSVCWETITYPRLLMGLESVWGRRVILSPEIKGCVLGICVPYDM